jgi:hypothetical protein
MLAPLIGEMLGVDKTAITGSEMAAAISRRKSLPPPSRLHSPIRLVLCAQVDECRGYRSRA